MKLLWPRGKLKGKWCPIRPEFQGLIAAAANSTFAPCCACWCRAEILLAAKLTPAHPRFGLGRRLIRMANSSPKG